MKTFECIAKSGNTGKEIVILIRAVDASQAKMNALVQARQQRWSHCSLQDLRQEKV
jgi:hypothetical protein